MTNWKEVKQRMNATRSMIKMAVPATQEELWRRGFSNYLHDVCSREPRHIKQRLYCPGAFKNKIILLNMGTLLSSGEEAAKASPIQQHRGLPAHCKLFFKITRAPILPVIALCTTKSQSTDSGLQTPDPMCIPITSPNLQVNSSTQVSGPTFILRLTDCNAE